MQGIKPASLYFRRPLAALPHPREAVRHFTPQWFAATMGTGIFALALGQLPFHTPVLHGLGVLLWLFNVGLFCLFGVLYTARWCLFFNEARHIFNHATVSMFVGAIPMGLATLINGLLAYGTAWWGSAAVAWAQALWWLDVAMALGCGVLVPYLMFTRQQHTIEQMTAVWLLPVVAAEVAAASGALLAPHLAAGSTQFSVLVMSYVLWAYSVPVALSMLVILLLRLALHKLPPENMAASSWLALGPVGTGALGMLLLGGEAPAIFAAQGMPAIGSVAAGLGVVSGLLFWGLGVWWFVLAVLVTVRYLRRGMPFNLGWWGFTFPLGVYALATLKLASVLHLGLLAGLGTAMVGLLAVLWLVVAGKTLAGAWQGTLFVSPCIAGLPCRQ